MWRLEQDLKRKKEEQEQLMLKASGLSNAGPVVGCSVSGQSLGATAVTRAPKRRKKSKQKRHPGLPSEERQEYYKSYLAYF